MDNKEVKETATATATISAENNVINFDTTIVRSPLFLLFAEFIGYASPLVEWAEKICENKTVPKSIEKAIMVDAVVIFEKMKKELSSSNIAELWDSYYSTITIFKDYDNNLIEKEKEDLPF